MANCLDAEEQGSLLKLTNFKKFVDLHPEITVANEYDARKSVDRKLKKTLDRMTAIDAPWFNKYWLMDHQELVTEKFKNHWEAFVNNDYKAEGETLEVEFMSAEQQEELWTLAEFKKFVDLHPEIYVPDNYYDQNIGLEEDLFEAINHAVEAEYPWFDFNWLCEHQEHATQEYQDYWSAFGVNGFKAE